MAGAEPVNLERLRAKENLRRYEAEVACDALKNVLLNERRRGLLDEAMVLENLQFRPLLADMERAKRSDVVLPDCVAEVLRLKPLPASWPRPPTRSREHQLLPHLNTNSPKSSRMRALDKGRRIVRERLENAGLLHTKESPRVSPRGAGAGVGGGTIPLVQPLARWVEETHFGSLGPGAISPCLVCETAQAMVTLVSEMQKSCRVLILRNRYREDTSAAGPALGRAPCGISMAYGGMLLLLVEEPGVATFALRMEHRALRRAEKEANWVASRLAKELSGFGCRKAEDYPGAAAEVDPKARDQEFMNFISRWLQAELRQSFAPGAQGSAEGANQEELKRQKPPDHDALGVEVALKNFNWSRFRVSGCRREAISPEDRTHFLEAVDSIRQDSERGIRTGVIHYPEILAHCTDEHGFTLLHHAALCGSYDCAQMVAEVVTNWKYSLEKEVFYPFGSEPRKDLNLTFVEAPGGDHPAGWIVAGLSKNGPADKAGVCKGDRVTMAGGLPASDIVADPASLTRPRATISLPTDFGGPAAPPAPAALVGNPKDASGGGGSTGAPEIPVGLAASTATVGTRERYGLPLPSSILPAKVQLKHGMSLKLEGLTLSVRAEGGWTALHAAAARGHLHVYRLLLRHGADDTVKDARGWTPKMWAAMQLQMLPGGGPPRDKTTPPVAPRTGASSRPRSASTGTGKRMSGASGFPRARTPSMILRGAPLGHHAHH